MSIVTRKKAIVQGISIDYIGSILSVVLGFVAVPYYLNYISKEEFGLWLAINGVIAIIALVDLATDQLLTTVTASDIKFYSEEYSDYLSSVMLIKVIVSVVLACFSAILYYFLTNIIDIDIMRQSEAKFVFVIGATVLIIGIYFSTITTILYARHHYSLISSFTNVFTMLGTLGTILLLSLGYGIAAFPLALLATAVIQNSILFVIMKRKYSNVRLRIKNFNFVDKRNILGYTASFQILRLMYTLRTQLINIFINNLVGPVYLTQYNLSNRLTQIAPTYSAKLVMPFFPSMSDLFQKCEIDKIANLFIRITRLLSRIAVFSGIAMIFLNKFFVMLWVGEDKYVGNAVNCFLVLYMVIYVAMAFFAIVIFASKKFERWVVYAILEIIITISSSYVLSLSYGLVGIVMGFVLSSLLTQLYLFNIVLRQLGLKKTTFSKKIIIYSVKPNILPFAAACVLSLFGVRANSWLSFVIIVCIFIVLHFVVDSFGFMNSNKIGIKDKLIDAMDI